MVRCCRSSLVLDPVLALVLALLLALALVLAVDFAPPISTGMKGHRTEGGRQERKVIDIRQIGEKW